MKKIDRWLDTPVEAITSESEQRSVTAAINAYLADCRARDLAASTIESYEKTFDHLKRFSTNHGITEVAALDVDAISRFRQLRNVAPTTQVKELQTLRAFCGWAVDRKWMPENAAKKVKMPRRDLVPTMPFTHDEIALMLHACAGFADGGGSAEHRRRCELRARALLLLLLYSGLRISDAALLRRDRLDARTRKIMLRTEKTHQPVYLTLHSDAYNALIALPIESDWFFWSGRGMPVTHVKNARRTVVRIIERAGIDGHPHRFRDTFAVQLLLAGEDLRTVQLLLGHRSIKTTERHYAPWISEMQHQLDAATAKLDFGLSSSGSIE